MSEHKFDLVETFTYSLAVPLIIFLAYGGIIGITQPQAVREFVRSPGTSLSKLGSEVSQMALPKLPVIKSPEQIKDEMARRIVEGCSLKLEDLGKGPITSPCAEGAAAAKDKFLGQ